MRNIYLALMVALFFLPQISFGADDPALTAFNVQENAKAAAFFQQQADKMACMAQMHQDRQAFQAAHPGIN